VSEAYGLVEIKVSNRQNLTSVLAFPKHPYTDITVCHMSCWQAFTKNNSCKALQHNLHKRNSEAALQKTRGPKLQKLYFNPFMVVGNSYSQQMLD